MFQKWNNVRPGVERIMPRKVIIAVVSDTLHAVDVLESSRICHRCLQEVTGENLILNKLCLLPRRIKFP